MMSAVMRMTQPGSIEKATPAAAVMPDTAAKRNSAARRLEDQPGFVLHSYPYSESSVIVETFTRAHGRVPRRCQDEARMVQQALAREAGRRGIEIDALSIDVLHGGVCDH